MKANPDLERFKKAHLQEKAKSCDAGLVGNAEPGHFQRMYSLIYRQLSPVTHLNVEGFQEFVEKNDYGDIVFSDNDDDDFIIKQAVSICLAFTKDLYENGILLGNPMQLIKDIELKLV